jgi:5-methylcytosine-specific restriction endonuclease McrA
VLDWKEAVTAMFKGTVTVLAQYDEVLAHLDRQTLRTFPELRRALRQVIGTDAEEITIKVPAVVVVHRKVAQQKNGAKFSKVNVCLRDDFSCQYCGAKLPMSALNYDHVVPRARGGKTCWENIVMACYPCNERKGCKTPEEAGLALLRMPAKPVLLPLNCPQIDVSRAPAEWEPYLKAS